MKYIGVVDCASTGQMYVDDIIDMGYRPLLIYTAMDVDHAAEGWVNNINSVRRGIGDKADYIQLEMSDTFDTAVAKLRAYDLVCIVPGTDSGVRLCDYASKALGLKGNDPDTSYLRVTKAGMDEALARAGVRHILTARISCEDDVRRFWNDNRCRKAVMKFSESAATVGLKICDSLEDCLDHYRALGKMYTVTGRSDVPILMQEFIGGTEYIVNSISVDGQHKITDVWRYEKIIQPDGVLVYDTCILVDRLVPGTQELLQYDYKVLDAVQMRNGFCHTEIKIDGRGPVLIETNPRPMGANLTREYLNEIFGSHMTDVTLKSLLVPSFFQNFMKTPYMPRKSAMFKFSIVPHEVEADLGPFFEIVRHLESFREILYVGAPGVQRYPRTIDLETSPFFIKLTNSNYGDLKRDYELLRQLEDRYFDMVFPKDDRVAAAGFRTDLEPIIRNLPSAHRFAIVGDDGVTVLQYGKRAAGGEWAVYDGVVFTMCGESTLTDRYRQMMKAMSQVRKGGLILITPEVCSRLPYGTVGAETMMFIMGFDAKIPPSSGNGMIYAIKR